MLLDDIPFVELSNLLETNDRLWQRRYSGHNEKDKELREQLKANLRSFLQQYQQQSSDASTPSTSQPIFGLVRLVFPHLDRERVYGMKEPGIAKWLLATNVLDTKSIPSIKTCIQSWTSKAHASSSSSSSSTSIPSPPHHNHSSSSLDFAESIYKALETRPVPKPSASSKPITCSQINKHLTELSTLSGFSTTELGNAPARSTRSVVEIFKDLFSGRSDQPDVGDASHKVSSCFDAVQVKWLIVILMKQPPTPHHGMHHHHHQRGEGHFLMNCFHPQLYSTYSCISDLRAACAAVEASDISKNKAMEETLWLARRTGENLSNISTGGSGGGGFRNPTLLDLIKVGTQVGGMKLCKGTSPAFVVKELYQLENAVSNNNPMCFTEVKYDGERMQVHVKRDVGGKGVVVALFSKSRRNSTMDRVKCHDLILRALGMHDGDEASALGTAVTDDNENKVRVEEAILDAELLVVDKQTGQVQEFHVVQQLSNLKIPGHHSARHSHNMNSSSSDPGVLERKYTYKIVFFDVLYLNGKPLIHQPLHKRRTTLESILHTPSSHPLIQLSELLRIPLKDPQRAVQTLRTHFLSVCARPAEGLVVKASVGLYTPSREGTWYKLKKDYIEGFGDTAEFAVIGGRYDVETSRYLGVTREQCAGILNVFVVGCRRSRIQADAGGGDSDVDDQRRGIPEIVPLFSFSAGFEKDQLLAFHDSTMPIRRKTRHELGSYSVRDEVPFGKGAVIGRIEVYFDPPVAVELKGGGFQSLGGKGLWALRGPRFVRLCSPERGFWDTISSEELDRIATAATGSASVCKEELAKLKQVDDQVLDKMARKQSLAGASTMVTPLKRANTLPELSEKPKRLRASFDIMCSHSNLEAMSSPKTATSPTPLSSKDFLSRHNKENQSFLVSLNSAIRFPWKDALMHFVKIGQPQADPLSPLLATTIENCLTRLGVANCRGQALHSLSALLEAAGWIQGGQSRGHFASGVIILVRCGQSSSACVATARDRLQQVLESWEFSNPNTSLVHRILLTTLDDLLPFMQ